MAAPMFNFNVGVLGHVDSGKTSLSKALSTTASTASFDKNPQSKERGITLDLGFSSFQVDAPDHLVSSLGSGGIIQYTLVDCPGHASLIKTIIGGAQIIDLMILVVDVVKGVQTQTAECLVIGEITCEKMIVVLNKVDLLPSDKKDAMIDKMRKKMTRTLQSTRFAGCPIVAVAANPGGAGPGGASQGGDTESVGLADLVNILKAQTYLPQRDGTGAFIFSVDHCFSIRGQGTVMTGTTLHGGVAVNDTVEIPSMKVMKKVKSIQMFRKPVDKIIQGDRAGVCVTQFEPKHLERGMLCSQGALPTIEAAVISVQKIPYYKGNVTSKAKFHITSGHDTVMGRLTFFGLYGDVTSTLPLSEHSIKKQLTLSDTRTLDFSKEYLYHDELLQETKSGEASAASADVISHPVEQFALIVFEKPVTCQANSLIIGSKLDTDIHANLCRIAFYGRLLEGISDPKYAETVLPKLKVYKTKEREGQVERVMDEYTVIGKNLFKKETNIATFSGLRVTLSTGEAGVIEGSFGQSGKVKVRIPGGLPAEIVQRYAGTKKKSKGKGAESSANEETESVNLQPIRIILSFKRYMYDPEKKMKQS